MLILFIQPFRTEGGDNILVLSECWMSDGTPNKYNYRHEAEKILATHAAHEPWFVSIRWKTMLFSRGDH